MFKILTPAMCVLLIIMGQTALANVEVSFYESAPKDRFVIKNTGKCLLQDLTLEIDFTKSAGRLIFDTTATGAGVEVFQPFEVTIGDISLISQTGVKDGDAKLALSIPSLASGKSASFTIDVDDTLPVSELGKIRISDSEIKDGMVKISSGKQIPASALFGSNSKAIVLQSTCSAF